MYKLVGLREVKQGEYLELHVEYKAPGLKFGLCVDKIFVFANICEGVPREGCSVDVYCLPDSQGKARITKVSFK